MSKTHARFALAGIAAAVLAACGGGGGYSAPALPAPSTNPGPSSQPSSTPSASPTLAPTPSAAPTLAPTPTPMPTQRPTPTPSPAQPQVIHIGFDLAEHTDPQFGVVYYYSTMLNGMAQVIRVTHGSQVVFLNDDPGGSPHTASGLGMGGFPAAFDNTSGFNAQGNTIDGSLTWSTGTLNHGQMSSPFTVGSPGTYYFGCAFHYAGVPSMQVPSMGDVLVSM